MATSQDVADIAREAAMAGDRGLARAEIRGVTFSLEERGWCARFVRMCHEAALGLRPFQWPYSSANARQMEDKLAANDKRTDNPVAGDIVCFNRNTGKNGHIGIYLGHGTFAENTSSQKRGPGTTLSSLAQMPGRVTGYYRVLPTELVIKVVLLPGSELLGTIDAPPDLDADYEIVNHLRDQGKFYLRRK